MSMNKTELAYVIKEANGGVYPYTALTDAVTRKRGEPSIVDIVAMKRGYKPSIVRKR